MAQISIIVPTYNRSHLLTQLIDSVKAQTFQDWQLIIVDDGSTDDTAIFVQKFLNDQRISFVALEKNQGVHAARNAGLDRATGKYVMFFDSDDELFANALADLHQAIEEHQQVALVSAPLALPNGELTGFDRRQPTEITFSEVLCNIGIRRIKAGVILIRKSYIGESRFVAPNLDFIFFRHLIKKAPFYFLPQPLGRYNLQTDDTQSLHTKRKKPTVQLSILRGLALADFVRDFADDFKKYCPEQLGSYAYGAALGLALAGKRKEASGMMKTAINSQPQRWKFKFFAWFLLLPNSREILRWLFQRRASK